jgi:hypothetical protein
VQVLEFLGAGSEFDVPLGLHRSLIVHRYPPGNARLFALILCVGLSRPEP